MKLYDLYLNKKDEIEICDNEKVEKLRSKYLELNNYDKNKIRIRLFFGGTELKDEEKLYKYKIKNNYLVQINKIDLE